MLRPHKNTHMQNALNAYAHLVYPNWLLDQLGRANAHTSPQAKHVPLMNETQSPCITQYHDLHKVKVGEWQNQLSWLIYGLSQRPIVGAHTSNDQLLRPNGRQPVALYPTPLNTHKPIHNVPFTKRHNSLRKLNLTIKCHSWRIWGWIKTLV